MTCVDYKKKNWQDKSMVCTLRLRFNNADPNLLLSKMYL